MAIAQPRAFGGFTGRRYGSFAGKTADHTVGVLTQPRAFGAYSGRRYGSFAGRQATVQPPSLVVGGGRIQIPFDLREALRMRLIEEDDLLLLLLASRFAKRAQ